MTRLLYSLQDAADQVSVSVQTLRRAIAATDPNAFPPPLKARRTGTEKKPSYRIEHDELVAWVNSLPSA